MLSINARLCNSCMLCKGSVGSNNNNEEGYGKRINWYYVIKIRPDLTAKVNRVWRNLEDCIKLNKFTYLIVQ